jgi:hypothetical protein
MASLLLLLLLLDDFGNTPKNARHWTMLTIGILSLGTLRQMPPRGSQEMEDLLT